MQLSSLIGHTQEIFGIIIKSNRPADSLIDIFFRSHKYLGSHDRRFIAENVYGTLRHLRKCKFILNSSLNQSIESLYDEDKQLLTLIIYLFLEGKGKEITPESISSKFKSTLLRESISDIIPNFLKPIKIPNDTFTQRIGIEYSYPDWMVQKFIDQYGEAETEKICRGLNEPALLNLRVNMLKTDVEKCREELFEEGIETSRNRLSPFGLSVMRRINVFSLKAFHNGLFEVQDEGSQLLPIIIDPKPNAKLLDLCAGAGGKTLEFAALMKNRGEIYATDINSFRLDELRKRAKRAGAQNIRIKKIEATEDLSDKFYEFFDIVFIDAPCSGIGTIRRNPGMKWLVTAQTIKEVTDKQVSILHSSASLVKCGGKLVYATCTLFREENEGVIEDFISKHPEFVISAIETDIPDIQKNQVMGKNQFISLFPHVHGTDGFFCAFLQKTKSR